MHLQWEITVSLMCLLHTKMMNMIKPLRKLNLEEMKYSCTKYKCWISHVSKEHVYMYIKILSTQSNTSYLSFVWFKKYAV